MPIPLIGGIAAAILVIVLFLLSYVKAPPDHAFLISGVKKQPPRAHRPSRIPHPLLGAHGPAVPGSDERRHQD